MGALNRLVKPRLPIIDFGNPITRGLIFDCPIYERTGTTTKELINKINGSIISSGATWDRNLLGTDLDFSAAASSVNFTTPSIINGLTGGFTLEVLALIRSAGGGGLGRIVQKTSGTTDTGTAWNFRLSNSPSNQLQFVVGFSVQAKAIFVNFSFDSLWHHFVIICSSLSSISSGTMSLYIDNILQTNATDNGASGTQAIDDTNLYIGNRSSNNRNFDGKIAYTRIWNRALSIQEKSLLYVNPWRIYRQNNPRFPRTYH